MIYKSDYYVGSDLNGDSLSHHGVPNQRWGVKNGPPYPVRRGHDVHYNVGKMTEKTKSSLRKTGEAVKSGVKSAGAKVKSSFQRWKNDKKAELAIKDTDNRLVKNWQKKQLRISDMSNQELQQRIDRKRLEESYKHALRGDFSDPKTWNKSSKDAKSGKGKDAADSILRRVGDAAIDGLAKGLTNKIADTMTTKAKAKVARREARRDAIAEVMRDAAKDRAQYRADQRNEAWRDRQDRRADARRERRKQRYNDSMNRARTGTIGLGSGNSADYYYYAGPGEGSVN